MMTNLARLKKAGILPPKIVLSPKEKAEIEKLTTKEVDFLIAMKERVKETTEMDMMIAPPTHHF